MKSQPPKGFCSFEKEGVEEVQQDVNTSAILSQTTKGVQEKGGRRMNKQAKVICK